jgi:hypothetical protein
MAPTAVILSSGPQTDDSDLPKATVHITVTDCFGHRDSGVQIRLRSREGNRQIVKHGNPVEIARLPYGYYTVLVTDDGGGMGERELAVNTGEIWVYLGASFPAGLRATPPGGMSILGEVSGASFDHDWWVRAEGVFLHASREAPISHGGRFTISGLEMGAYVVEVFNGSKLRHAETVELNFEHPERQLQISVKPD